MHLRPAVTLLICCASLVLAQDRGKENLCSASSAAVVDRDGEVIVQKVVLSGKWGSNEATVYLPGKEVANGAVVFSHSAIHADSGAAVDLLPLALTLAHAGAAVIVPERTLVWPPTEPSMNREGGAVICATHWLVDHTRVFNNGEPTVNEKNFIVRLGYAYVGPKICHPAAADCSYRDPFLAEDCALGDYCREHA
jgi:hypothetical protein